MHMHMHKYKYVIGQTYHIRYHAPCAWLQAMRAQPAERPTAEQMHCHAWLRGPLVNTPLARLASADEAGAGALCVAQLAAALPPV